MRVCVCVWLLKTALLIIKLCKMMTLALSIVSRPKHHNH